MTSARAWRQGAATWASYQGLTHVGRVCDDIAQTRAELESRGVQLLVSGIARIAGLQTTWFADPYGTVFILMQKGDPDRPHFAQY